MKDDPLKHCTAPLCRMKKYGHGAVKRLIGTGAGLLFKGSGFYITDYRSEGYKASAKSESSSSSESKPSETKSTESKPATEKSTEKPKAPAKASTPKKDT